MVSTTKKEAQTIFLFHHIHIIIINQTNGLSHILNSNIRSTHAKRTHNPNKEHVDSLVLLYFSFACIIRIGRVQLAHPWTKLTPPRPIAVPAATPSSCKMDSRHATLSITRNVKLTITSILVSLYKYPMDLRSGNKK